MKNMMKKVNYSEYEGKYDDRIKESLEKIPEEIDFEKMRDDLDLCISYFRY